LTVTAVGLLASGCGSGSHRALPVLSITERDFRITVTPTVPAGVVPVTLHNEGPVSHELLIIRAHGALPLRADGFTIDEDALHKRLVILLEPMGPSTRHFVVHLVPGRYIVLCNMAGHAASGMKTSFVAR
jgi:uncharacterized cupredoxin-like copper-binding protein